MKFAREYEAKLKQEQYPQHWIQSSISYRQLKKCIRKIQSELLELGIDPEEVKVLLQRVESASANGGHPPGPVSSLRPNAVNGLIWLICCRT